MTKRTGIVLLAVIIVILISGCTENISAGQIAQKMKEKQDDIKDFSATMVTMSLFDGKNETTKVNIKNKMPGKSRMEYLEPAEMAGQIVVSDGITIWTYDAKKKEATGMRIPEINKPSERDYTRFIKELLNQTDISYQGIDKFEGRSVYRIKASPKNDSIWMGMHIDMWVDSENWMPLKINVIDKNDKLMSSLEYRDIKFNTGILDSEFEFKLPEGAKFVTKDISPAPKIKTLEEARKKVNYAILAPSYLPEGYTLVDVDINNDMRETVFLFYLNGSRAIMLVEKRWDDKHPAVERGKVEKASINGIEGKLMSQEDSNEFVWKVGDRELSLSTSALSKEELLKIAESIK
jgi:outer membrane lipoprotein-sorting protein